MAQEKIPISEIIPYENNPRKNKKAVEIVAKSIKEYGFRSPVILDKNNVVIAGHTRLEAARQLGLSEVPVIWADDLTPEQVRGYRIMDNKSSEYAGWDIPMLKDELSQLRDMNFNLEFTGFNFSELDKMIPNETEEDTVEVNAYERAKQKTKIQQGEVYHLGNHRLMCGDSTEEKDFLKLMGAENEADLVITDPPYNTGMDRKNVGDSTRLNHMFNDNMKPEDYKNLLEDSLALNTHNFTKENCAMYIFINWKNYPVLKEICEKFWKVSNLIIWDKEVHGLGSDYKYTHEFIVVAKKGKPELNTHQNEEYKDIWHLQRKVGKNEDHATVKPIKLLEIPIRHGSVPGGIILDPFGGSGSTLIACEQTNRKCFMMEIDPVYCQVIIDRWEKLTGNKAVKQ